MIKSWGEIQERFDAIKDHKPRATKKLAELGEILSSAYRHDPEEASNMWQYIIDLNIADDIKFSKFYIVSVFNKIKGILKPEEAVEFLSMNPERVRIMLTESDDRIPWYHLEDLLRGYIAADDPQNAIVCIGYYYDMFGGVESGSVEIIDVTRRAIRICKEFIADDEKKETVECILDELRNLGSQDVSDYIELVMFTCGLGDDYDYGKLFEIARENHYASEFFELLWAARNEFDEDELREKWVDYVENCGENDSLPWSYLREEESDDDDEIEYEDSRLKFYVDLEKESDELLEAYFGRASTSSIEEGVIWEWIESEDWDRFSRYIAAAIMATPEESFEMSGIKRKLESFMDASMYKDYMDCTDDYGRSYKKLMKEHVDGFIEALSKASAIAVGSGAHESFHELVKNYIQKKSGNLDALNAAGFDDEVETRSAEERLKEYVHDFLESGVLIHEERGTKYSLIMDALRDEANDSQGDEAPTIKIDLSGILAKALGVELDDSEDDKEDDEEDKEDEIDEELEQNYRLALDDEIAEFYFKHCPRDYFKRKDLLSACIRKNDVGRAVELIDLMAETKENEGYEELNGWGRQNMLTLGYLIDEYEYGKEDRWDSHDDITDEMRENVKQLVYRMLPHLSEKSRVELKEKWLFKIDPQSEDADDYINQLLEDAIVYTTFPKPRGKGGAQNVNRMSDEFIHCFERLSKMGRLDVVAEIMSKFASVRDVLKPVNFDSWMSFMARGLRSGDMIKVYRANKGIFEAWLENDNLRDWDIKRVAEGIADGCTREEFMDFRNLVVSRKGKIDGLDSCFQASSDNTETQTLLEAETVKIDLDYIEIEGDDPIGSIEIHLLSTAKTEKLDSVRLLKCEINGIETTDCGFTLEMDEEPKIGYYIFDTDEESDDDLTIYSDFFEDNDINEANKIVLQFVIMDDDADVIEEVSEAIIELDDETGEYKVTQVATSEDCYVDIEDDDDEDDEDDDDEEDDEIEDEEEDIDFDEDEEDDEIDEDEDEDEEIEEDEEDWSALIDADLADLEESDDSESLENLSAIVQGALGKVFGFNVGEEDEIDEEDVEDEDNDEDDEDESEEADSEEYDFMEAIQGLQDQLSNLQGDITAKLARKTQNKEYMSLERIIEKADFQFPIDVQAYDWEDDKHMQLETIRGDLVYGSIYKGNEFVDMERLPLKGSGKYTFYNT